MYPYIDIGPAHLGTFGLLLWLAAVAATYVLHRNFIRNKVDADALNVVALVVVIGIIGAKAWHELQNPHALRYALRVIGIPDGIVPSPSRTSSSAGSAMASPGSAA
jgi:phosphatidylglycerol:prolipoprotein diacylglycerol transferase